MRQDEYCDGIAAYMSECGRLIDANEAWASMAVATYLREQGLEIRTASVAPPAIGGEATYPDWKALAHEWEGFAGQWRKVVTTTCTLLGISPALSAQESMDAINAALAKAPQAAAPEAKGEMDMRIQVKPEFDRKISREDEAKRRVDLRMDPATFNYDADEEIPQRAWLLPMYEAIWDEIKTWDIGVPTEYFGYTGATGTHVYAIMKAMQNRGLITLPESLGSKKEVEG